MTLRRTYIPPSVSTWLDMIRRQASELQTDTVRPAQLSDSGGGTGSGGNPRRLTCKKATLSYSVLFRKQWRSSTCIRLSKKVVQCLCSPSDC